MYIFFIFLTHLTYDVKEVRLRTRKVLSLMFQFKEVGYLTDGEIDLIIEKKVPAHLEKFAAPSYHFQIKKHLMPYEIGKIDIRIGYNENTFYGGNIGYEIYPPYRGHHYAAKACEIIKRIAKIHGMNYLYISCLPDNIASNKTCQLLGSRWLGRYVVPFYLEMYLMGVREINVYEWDLNMN